MWHPDGKELFFIDLNDGTLMAAGIETANGTLRPRSPVPLNIHLTQDSGVSIDGTGQQFLVSMPLAANDQGPQIPITVVTNWEATLNRQ